MLNSLLEKLPNFFSKRFATAFFLPLVIAVALNGSLLYSESDGFRHWLGTIAIDKATPATEAAALIFALFFVASYVLSSVSGFLRDVGEGKHWPPSIARRFAVDHRDRLDDLVAAIRSNERARGDWD